MRILIITAALFMTLHAPVQATASCGEHKPMKQQLEAIHKEAQRAVGLSSGGGLIEVFASPTGTWTILMVYPNGTTCVVASGESWEQFEAEAQGEKI